MNSHSANNARDTSVLFLIRSLGIGGAERQLALLAMRLVAAGVDTSIAVFYDTGKLVGELRTAGVPVLTLEKRGRWDVLPFYCRLVRLLRDTRPGILHSYLPVSNVLSVLARPFVPSARVIWGIRASSTDAKQYGWLEWSSLWLECRLCRFAHLIITNSAAGRARLRACGVPDAKMLLIPNGIDTRAFSPDSIERIRVRSAWGLGQSELLIGNVARLDPIKGHRCFLEAAAMLSRARPELRFLLVGHGPSDYRAQMAEYARTVGLGHRLIWAGEQTDMPPVYNALDVACSSSFGEGFSNAIAEAMACEVPCVVTDVGDSAFIVGDAGIVVPPNRPDALAEALLNLVTLEQQGRAALGKKARQRIVDLFGVDHLVRDTLEAFDRIR